MAFAAFEFQGLIRIGHRSAGIASSSKVRIIKIPFVNIGGEINLFGYGRTVNAKISGQ